MTGQVNDCNLMLEQQGKRVRVEKSDGSHVWALTVVHVVGVDKHELHLCNREHKSGKPDWALTQKLWEAIEPAEKNDLNCEYALTIK